MSSAMTIRPDVMEPVSQEDDSNFRMSLQITMEKLVGDAVGNMSISPSSRDVVLATRNGLFIIDLEAPLNVPRFLPQGGTWDVADVQWNPHLSRSEYIVSTSSEKLLIWNLYMTGKTSIEHVLRSHYRAITDINWHNTEPDVVVSTGIDSWLWAWDLRAAQKPVMGLCAFGSGGTQVKWNRQDSNLLASSHQNEVLLWDRRKGSLPVSRIRAHTAKIYGIDWVHGRSNEILTCSLDKSIKLWDTQDVQQDGGHVPKLNIHTAYPVWRARDLPFGRGLLSLPQRSETALEMYAYDDPHIPVDVFQGHADVVKEFVWRRGGQDCSDFQLITWSKDKTLRFWPIDAESMHKAGLSTPTQPHRHEAPRRETKVSFSNPPVGNDLPPKLSAPVGHRGILAEVRAPVPIRPSHANNPKLPLERELAAPQQENNDSSSSRGPSKPIPIAQERGTMTRGHLAGRSAPITPYGWISSIEFGTKREGSSGPNNGTESGNVSRVNSASRPPSVANRSMSLAMSNKQRNGERRGSQEDDHREGEPGHSLHDEITSVINKLSTSKVKLEDARDLTKKRKCTFGLHGPWGEGTSVFIRTTFTFPRDYPQASYPNGIPRVDMDRTPLIDMPTRAFILRRLRVIREKERPCLEKCLRFLLFGDDEKRDGRRNGIDSESSSDEDMPPSTRRNRGTSFSLLRTDKNLAEPRTSQGVFGPNGQLVCFFPAPPRIVKNAMREISVSPSLASRGPDTAPRLFQSPALLSDAVRRLTDAAQDRASTTKANNQADDAGNILRIMTNLFTYSQLKSRRVSEHSRPVEDIPASYSLLPQRRSSVLIKDTAGLVGIDAVMASEYTFAVDNPADCCKENADIAKARGRIDHERIMRILEAVFTQGMKSGHAGHVSHSTITRDHRVLAVRVLTKLYQELSQNKDIQMLAMLSALLLRTTASPAFQPHKTPDIDTPEYRRALQHRISLSPMWSRTSLSPTPVAPPLSSPTSSRGSWSSLFNTNSMRQLMTGPKTRMPIPLPDGGHVTRGYPSPNPGQHRDSSVQRTPPITKSWSEAPKISSLTSTVTFSSAGHTRRPTFSQVLSAPRLDPEQKRLNVHIAFEPPDPLSLLQKSLRTQLLCHVLAYAEMLLAWGLPNKRTELLKSVERELLSTVMDSAVFDTAVAGDRLGCARICEHGVLQSDHDSNTECAICGGNSRPPTCSVCRLPAKGISHNCLICGHVTHVSCLGGRAMHQVECATGCGCYCTFAASEPSASINAGHLPPPAGVLRL
ncbi:uncharacterized protein C8Q71DRAFT_21868 [Rhodofomes roseus]|uniref:WDR59/RTC1-like RING zinc finger domain-containing protein n=1 Tax=Rhodofomes roseus TaxID=34475 RepID=A0ABQ8KXC9_9APHY|nr:uncharacterized protein C8Q71DRAFT_21868 [Rhodofomes roseus]KAH9843960.1 hypothetical protein C8Q71DRAFT_21868 [Rhodofomes roseus]